MHKYEMSGSYLVISCNAGLGGNGPHADQHGCMQNCVAPRRNRKPGAHNQGLCDQLLAPYVLIICRMIVHDFGSKIDN